MRTFKALLKREYWEHKGAIIKTPAVMAAILAALFIIGALTDGFITVNAGDNERRSFGSLLLMAADKFEQMPEGARDEFVKMALLGPVMLFGGVMLVISLFFALGSLYDERKDRSILFWKSLPVSDTATVLSKFVAVTLLVPLSYFAVITLFQLFMLISATVGAWFSGNTGLTFWISANLFSVVFNSLLSLIVASLWLSPVWGWMMLASAWAKKVAFLWAALPIAMITAAEGYLFHSTKFIEVAAYRVAHGFAIANSNLHLASGGDLFDINVMTWSKALGNSELYIGFLVAAVFLGAAVYTRRFRDES
jgi:ABC-2 type transport system permease protein